jgi:hypothetical protein
VNLTKFFTNEGDIAGLEINDSALRLVLLKPNKKAAPKVKFSLEEILPEGDIQDGVIKNPAGFLKGLKNLLARAKPKIKFVVVTIPAEGIYAKVFSFPPGVVGEKLESSIQLASTFQLPKENDKVYLDWEKLPEVDHNLALLSLADRARINDLVVPIESCGLKVLAIEYHQMSLARALTLPAGQAVMVIEKNSTDFIFSVIKNKTVRFLRSLPRERLRSSLGSEASRIRDYFEIEDSPLVKIILLGNFSREESSSLLSLKNGLEVSELPTVDTIPPVALGASLRGLIPRADDNLISLLESGTEEAYEQKKALTFADFLTKITLLISAFFILAYAGTWLLVVRIEENFNKQITVITARPNQGAATELESAAAKYNSRISQTSTLAKEEISWSKLLTLVNKTLPPGLTITDLTANGVTSPITLVGVSKDRPTLKAFKKNLDETPEFKDIILPQTNLEKKNDIPFMVSFNLADPNQFNLNQ